MKVLKRKKEFLGFLDKGFSYFFFFFFFFVLIINYFFNRN